MTSRPSRFMLGWIGVTIAVVAIAGTVGLAVTSLFGMPGRRDLPVAFLASTALLVVVSAGLAKAEGYAKRERQAKLRRALLTSLAAALAFLVVQALALTGLVREIAPTESATEPTAFVFAAVALHALHVAAAALWLIYVTLRGFAGSYDHECRFGLTACAFCWHALGVVWVVILAACLATV
ncbi:MAG: cytochrome c oxidase subunit 3 [Planctomycetaceae bacterium]|nr:cytochrome c oxidase subunit 3 [Planctomycetaceae bacterium]